MKSKSSANPLDLNHLPEDNNKDGNKKKKGGGKDIGKEESGKIYECRFCSLKFGKSQALGGHMNRHRQERETETLNRARQIVNENLAAQGVPQLGAQPINPGCYHQAGLVADPALPYRPFYPARMFPASSTVLPPPQHQPYIYPAPPRLVSYPSHAMTDYYIGHYGHPSQGYTAGAPDTTYTCIGAPVGPGLVPAATGVGPARPGSDGEARDGSLQSSQEEGLSWAPRHPAGSTQQHLDGL